MLKEPALTQQIELLWQVDGDLGRTDTIYRKHFAAAESETRRLADYATGVRLGLTVNKPAADVIRQYKRKRHGEVIDVGIFRVGYERGRFLDQVHTPGVDYLINPVSKQPFNPKTDVGHFADIHLLHNPFRVGQRIQSPLGAVEVTDARQAVVQLTPGGLFIKPGLIDTFVPRDMANRAAVTTGIGGNSWTPPRTYATPAKITASSYITSYLLDLNNLPALEIIPRHERYLRVPPSNRLR